MGVTVKKCHMIMSGNDYWNSVCFSCCCMKADNELADCNRLNIVMQVSFQATLAIKFCVKLFKDYLFHFEGVYKHPKSTLLVYRP